MTEGQKYIFYDKSGKRNTGIWIGSALDIPRYLEGNVFDIDGKTPLFKKRRFAQSTDSLEGTLEKIYEKHGGLIIRNHGLRMELEKASRNFDLNLFNELESDREWNDVEDSSR